MTDKQLVKDSKGISQFFHNLNVINITFGNLTKIIPQLEDEKLIELHAYLQEIGHRTWIAQCCILAEARKRAQRGDKSIELTGAEFSIGRRQSYYDAQIWETFFEGKSADDLHRYQLQEKSWYQAAVTTEDPLATLRMAEDKKATNPKYGIREFKQDIAPQVKQQPVSTSSSEEPLELNFEGQILERSPYETRLYPEFWEFLWDNFEPNRAYRISIIAEPV